jgi:hypothetical protein
MTKKPPSKAIQRWDTEGGAAENGPQQEPRRKRPRDAAQLAKLVVDIATGEVEDREPTLEECRPELRDGLEAPNRHW